MSSAAFVFVFEILTLAGSALTALKLYKTGLYRRYRMFFLLFLFRVPNTIWPLLVDFHSQSYEKFWILTEPIVWVLYILVVFELYRLVMEKHRGLYSLGRWILYVAVPVAVFISILTLIPHFKPTTPQHSRMLGYFFAIEHGVDFSLVIIILLILVFLSRYPVHLSRNVLVHVALYSIFFLCETLSVVLASVFGVHIYADVALLRTGIASACGFAWFFLLTRKGEEVETNVPLFGADYERRALQQLDALNATLLRISRN